MEHVRGGFQKSRRELSAVRDDVAVDFSFNTMHLIRVLGARTGSVKS